MFNEYPKQVILKDGTEIVLRILRPSDFQELREFFNRIPEEERWLTKHDLADSDLIEDWVEHIDPARAIPVVADLNGRLVGQAVLHRHRYGCTSHIGRLRIMVDPEFRSRRLGTWLMFDIINLGITVGLERLEARFAIGPEDAAIRGCRKLDFYEAARLPRYAKSLDGEEYYDLMVMIKRLHAGWDDF